MPMQARQQWSLDDLTGMSPNEGASLKSDGTNGTGNSCDTNGCNSTTTDVVHVSQPAAAVTTKSSMANVAPEKVRLGIACMSKKMKSATMQSFIHRFELFGRFSVIPFDEAMLLNDPVESWPHVDCAIMFNSSGFPLQKACDYYTLHKRDTYFLTEPESQKVLLDRRDFYEAMSLNNIPLPPNHVFCNRDGYRGAANSVVEEFDDHIVVDGRRLDKPFVEKPVDAEDHAVYIYYPQRMGGGCRQMFRKVKNQSSQFVPDCNRIRVEGSYLYESFVDASLTDIKCYTVGPDFVHAESRKAPTVDGVVDRDAKGKEVRETVQLFPAELMVARKVIKVFRQMVCGFDILRASETEFYVCDVNGWSFVKNNDEYVDRAAAIMRDIFLDEVGKRGLHRVFRRMSTPRELMGVVGVFRHADRTPKQKLKLNITSEAIIKCAFDGALSQRDEVVFKGEHPKLDEFEEVIEAELINEAEANMSRSSESVASKDDAAPPSPKKQKEKIKDGKSKQKGRSRVDILQLMRDVLSRRQEGLKMQVKPKAFNDRNECIEAQLVCKWGGWITKAGERQAQNVGQNFVDRVFGHECGAMYMRDVHVSTNNERRVISTARNFIDYVTHHRNTVIPVDEPLLGDNSNAKAALESVNAEVSKIMHCDDPVESQHLCGRYPGMEKVLQNFVLSDDERTPLRALKRLHTLVSEVVNHVNNSWRETRTQLHRNEPLVLLRQRWTNLMKSLILNDDDEPPSYDVTKLTDVFDYVSYDVCYNQRAFHPIDLYPLFTLAQPVSAFVAEYENGLDRETKLLTGSLIGEPLLRRIYTDLVAIARAGVPRTRLYFTSASHVNALRNMLYCSNATAFHRIGEPLELHFLSHFVFKVYRYRREDEAPAPPEQRSPNPFGSPTNSEAGTFPSPKITRHTSCIAPQYSGIATVTATGGSTPSSTTSPALEKETFQIEVHFSTGVDKNMFGIVQGHHAQYAAVSHMIRIHNNLTFREFLEIVRECQRIYEDQTKTTLPPVQDHGRSLSTPVASDVLMAAPLPEMGGAAGEPEYSFPATPDHKHLKHPPPLSE